MKHGFTTRGLEFGRFFHPFYNKAVGGHLAPSPVLPLKDARQTCQPVKSKGESESPNWMVSTKKDFSHAWRM